MSKTLDELQSEIGAWHKDRMPGAIPIEVVRKFREEADEFFYSGGSREESADIVIALCAYANLEGYSLFDEIESKMAVNRDRQWERQPDGTYRHVSQDGEKAE